MARRGSSGSSLAGGTGKPEPLYLFDAKAFTESPVTASDITVQQDKATYPDCPSAPDFAKFASHGLDFHGASGRGTLYVVNHGGREVGRNLQRGHAVRIEA